MASCIPWRHQPSMSDAWMFDMFMMTLNVVDVVSDVLGITGYRTMQYNAHVKAYVHV